MTKFKQSSAKGGLLEWQRTVLLLLLLGIGLGVVYWTNTNVNSNFVDQFEEPAINEQPAETDGDNPTAPALGA